MKRVIAICLTIICFACKHEPKDYATLSGKIENPHESKTLKVFKGRDYEKIITINEDGTFKDTLKITEGDYTIKHGKEFGQIFLKNDNQSSFSTNYDSFIESMVFTGDAEETNNFSVQTFLLSKKHFTEDFITNGTKESLETTINNYKTDYKTLKEKYADVDSIHVALMDKNVEGSVKQLTNYMSRKIATRSQFIVGAPSPTFVDYENYSGGNTSLSDLKGKYVYMDIWATWCGPCKAEIPSLKKVEKQFKDKNIEFVSISVDEGRGYKGDAAKAYKAWKKMVAEKELGGVQLLADNGFRSTFIQDYKIQGIPRFILIDPDGNIVNADAPRPSNPALVKLFNGLNI